jgi:hypothetical protein
MVRGHDGQQDWVDVEVLVGGHEIRIAAGTDDRG